MSLRLSRASLARIAGILVCGTTFAALGGCAHRSPTAYELTAQSFPGLQVIRMPNGGFSMRILGASVGGGQPLYIIDGSPVPIDPDRGIDWFTPEDIVKVKVLKDPAETTVYGPLGINGVVLITTTQRLRVRKPAGSLL